MFGELSNVLKNWDWSEISRQFASSNLLHNPIIVLLSLAFSGLAIKAATAVFNAYVMRCWNNYVHPDEIAAAKAAIKKIEAQVKDEQREVEAFRAETNMLLAVNDRMYQEIIALRMNNAQLKQKLEELNSKSFVLRRARYRCVRVNPRRCTRFNSRCLRPAARGILPCRCKVYGRRGGVSRRLPRP